MKAIEIKEKRKKLGLTQKELANLIGVSVQTVNGYENGKEIPTTKYQILDTILNKEEINYMINEPPELYILNSGTHKKIEQIQEIIKEREKIITLSKENSIIEHQKELIKLLHFQIEQLKKSIKNVESNN
jgi:transcriptional regulator with XRE-family HTH domain